MKSVNAVFARKFLFDLANNLIFAALQQLFLFALDKLVDKPS